MTRGFFGRLQFFEREAGKKQGDETVTPVQVKAIQESFAKVAPISERAAALEQRQWHDC
jgi:hypothetical protein